MLFHSLPLQKIIVMEVSIWSDIACPFCYIGKHHFELALQELDAVEEVHVRWKSFELDINAQINYDDDIYTLLANKYGQTREWAQNSAGYMRDRGASIGLEFNFDQMIPTNTFDAHRLVHLSKSIGKQNETKEALFQAHFRDGRHIGQNAELLEIGRSVGLDNKVVSAMLASNEFAKDVRADEYLAQRYGISAVPFFVINKQYGISGAQPVPHFVQTLKRILKEEEGVFAARQNEAEGMTCGTDGCESE